MASEWPIVRIEDIAEKVAMGPFGSDIKTENFVAAGVPVIRGCNLTSGRFHAEDFVFLTEEKANDLANANAFPSDIVFTHRGTLGQVGLISEAPFPRYVVSQSQMKLTCDPTRAIPEFIYYYFKSPAGQHALLMNTSQTGVPAISRPVTSLKSIQLSLPPLREQRAIAHILGTLDDKIELNRRRNQTLEAMARALFKDWFVDFGPVRAKLEGREPYLPADLWQLFPDRLDDEGKPEGWEMVPASELIELNPTEPLRKGTPAPYLDMASLPTSGSWPEPPVIRDFGSGMRFRNGDTLLARITPCLENGKTAFVQCLPDDTVGWGSTEYIVMRPKAPVPAGYAYLLARDDAFREHAIRSMTGTSGRQRAQGDSIATFKLASPPDEDLWHAFERQVSPTFESIKSNAKASETLSALRDTLLPKLISGELRIADAEKFVEAAQ